MSSEKPVWYYEALAYKRLQRECREELAKVRNELFELASDMDDFMMNGALLTPHCAYHKKIQALLSRLAVFRVE